MVAAGPDAANYLIIPNYHVELLTELHDSWWQDVKMLLQAVPTQLASYNVTVNYGRDAGQSVSHLHFWVVPRLPGQPASGKGMTGLIGLVNAGGAAA